MRNSARTNIRRRTATRQPRVEQGLRRAEAPEINFTVSTEPHSTTATVTMDSIYPDHTVKHIVELSELTQVNQTLLELCNELLDD